MSKLAGALDDGNVQSIAAIEGSDINDGWIIDNTMRQAVGNGHMKLVIMMPDGVPLESAPFMADQQRQVMRAWMDAVRQEAVNRAHAKADEARQAKLKEIRDRDMGSPPTAPTVHTPASSVPSLPPSHLSEIPQDPSAYAKAMLARATAEVDHWTRIGLEAVEKKNAAQEAALKWGQLVAMFTLPNSKDQ